MSVHNYHEHLKSVGIADTRTMSIALALDNLHRAIAQLDQTNLSLLEQSNPEAIKAVNRLADCSNCLRKF